MMLKNLTFERCYQRRGLQIEEEITGEKLGGECYLMEVSISKVLHMDPGLYKLNYPGSQKTIFSLDIFHIGEFLYKGL